MKKRPHVTADIYGTPWGVCLLKKCVYIAAGYALDTLVQKALYSKTRRSYNE